MKLRSFINTDGRSNCSSNGSSSNLRVKSFWGESENAVRIQIHVAIITYCIVGIIEHNHQVGRPIIEVMRILGHSLLVQDDINELLKHPLVEDEKDDDRFILASKPINIY